MVGRGLHKMVRYFANRVAVVLTAFVALGLLASLALNLTFLNPVAQVVREFSLTDVFYHVLQESDQVDTSRVVTIVDMTELQRRGKIVDVMQEIEKYHPKVVGVDIVFEGLKDDTISDSRLRVVASDYRENTVYSYRMLEYIDDEVGYAEDVHSFFVDEGIDVKEGFTDFERTLYGGMKRELSLHRKCRGEERTSLVVNVLNQYTDGQLDLGGMREININFRPMEFRVIPCDSVEAYCDLITDRIVLFGATYELTDMHYTPLGKIAGIKLLAYSVQTLLDQRQVKHLPMWLAVLVSFVIALASWMWLSAYSAWANRLKSKVLSFFFTMTFVKGVLIFIWMALLMWMTFVIFCKWHISINLAWGLASIPLLPGANEFCNLIGRIIKQGQSK